MKISTYNYKTLWDVKTLWVQPMWQKTLVAFRNHIPNNSKLYFSLKYMLEDFNHKICAWFLPLWCVLDSKYIKLTPKIRVINIVSIPFVIPVFTCITFTESWKEKCRHLSAAFTQILEVFLTNKVVLAKYVYMYYWYFLLCVNDFVNEGWTFTLPPLWLMRYVT